MIGLSSMVFDILGNRIFDKPLYKSTLSNEKGERRVSRTATLDGGAVLYDTGYAVGDKIIDVTERDATSVAVAWAKYIVGTYNTVLVCVKDGAYIGAPHEYYVDSKGVLHITILVTEEA